MATMPTVTKTPTNVDAAFAVAPHHLRRLLGSQEVADRFLVVALNQVRKVPQLATCSKESLIDALVRMARLGLDPSIPNEVYLVPFKNEASLIIGYGGLRKLVLRTPEVHDVFAQAVCENDLYTPADSPVALPTHRLPEAFKPRGRAIGYYAAAYMRSGLWRVVSMSKAEVAAHRDRYSPSAKSTFWQENLPDKEGFSNFDKMAMKTVLRQLCSPRYLSLTADISEALQTEEALYRPVPPALQSVSMAPEPEGSLPLATLAEELYGPTSNPTANAPGKQVWGPAPGSSPGQALEPHPGVVPATSQIVEESGTPRTPTPDAALDALPQIEAVILAHGGTVEPWMVWAERRFKKPRSTFEAEDYAQFLAAVTAQSGRQASASEPSRPEGAAWETLRASHGDTRLPEGLLDRIRDMLEPNLIPVPYAEAQALAGVVLGYLADVEAAERPQDVANDPALFE